MSKMKDRAIDQMNAKRHNDKPKMTNMNLAEQAAMIEARHMLYSLLYDLPYKILDKPIWNGKTPRTVMHMLDKIVENL